MSLVTRYAARLGLSPPADPITLGEGDTPLLPSVALGPRWGLRGLWFKCDHLNPTGSYKDRFNAFVVNLMRTAGQTTCLATSSGNTGSSLAALGARGGIRVILVINEETPAGKLSQMAAHGAELLRARGFGKDLDESARIFARLQELGDRHGVPMITSAFRYCPQAMRGVSTMSYEIVAQLGGPPDACFVPVGGGGMLSAMAMGFADEGGGVRMEPVQPAGNDTIVTPLRQALEHAVPVTHGRGTSISGLSVPNDIDGTLAMGHVRRSGGHGFVADEDFIREVQAELYLREGLSVEPAGAVSVAGVKLAAEAGLLGADETVVAVLTGQGFKDPGRERAIADWIPVREVTLADLTDDLLR